MKTDNEYAKHCIGINLPKVINSTVIEIVDKVDTHSFQGIAGHITTKCIESYKEICSSANCYIYNKESKCLVIFLHVLFYFKRPPMF